MKLQKLAVAAALFVIPLSADAQTVSGAYVAASGGLNWWATQSREIPGFNALFPNPGPKMRIQTNSGSIGVTSLGWGFGNGFRAELEGSYRHNAAKDVRMLFAIPSPYVSNIAGSVTTAAVMTNILYDIGSNQGWPVHFTVGAGLGYASNRLSNVSTRPDGTSNSVMLNDSAGGFAYQAIAGVSIPAQHIPGLSITLDYRYLAGRRQAFDGVATNGRVFVPISGRYDNNNQAVMMGLRYKL